MARTRAGTGRRESVPAVRIRMYNVGFGDCFLLFIPTDDGERTMLVDCGKHLSSTTGHAIREAAEDVVKTVTQNGRPPRLDIVVATHRHFDHISGFDRKQWDDVEVGEVWMPWTEQVGNPDADRIRRDQKRLALALTRRFGKFDGAAGALAWNSFSNSGAEKRLRSGFAGRPVRRYLPKKKSGAHEFTSRFLPGVRIHALGPSHDRDVISLLEPPKGEYFPMVSGSQGTAAAAGTRSRRSRAGGGDGSRTEVSFPPIFAEHYRFDAAKYAGSYPRLAKATSRDALDEQSKLDLLAAASGLEDAINGTSLVFALEIGEACILLAGDAEWGTWSKILDDSKSRELLRRTRAYKVSHHGSYNGTPKRFVDDILPSDAVSLVSLGHMDKWPSIPRQSLLDELGAHKRRLVRSDSSAPSIAGVETGGTGGPDGPLWTELTIPIG